MIFNHSKVLFSTTQSKTEQNWFVFQFILFLNRALLCSVHSLFEVIYANTSFDNVLKTPSTISLRSVCFCFLYYILWLFFLLIYVKRDKIEKCLSIRKGFTLKRIYENRIHITFPFFLVKIKTFSVHSNYQFFPLQSFWRHIWEKPLKFSFHKKRSFPFYSSDKKQWLISILNKSSIYGLHLNICLSILHYKLSFA
jgi:hypothetical protein